MTGLPNPLAAMTQLFAKAFAALAERDGAGGRNAFVVTVDRSKPRRSVPATTSHTHEPSTHNSPGPSARSAREPGISRQRRFTDARWASIRACEPELTTHAGKE
jgi:hypothetical protein